MKNHCISCNRDFRYREWFDQLALGEWNCVQLSYRPYLIVSDLKMNLISAFRVFPFVKIASEDTPSYLIMTTGVDI